MNLKKLMLMGIFTCFTSCTGIDLKKYQNEKPHLKLEEYFNGNISATGIVQDWRGNIINRFDIKMKGSWQENEGILEENFSYYDGKKQKRIWKISKIAENIYEGKADDIIDKASGKSTGNSVNWHYVMDLPVGDKKYKIKFDDWMWLMNNKILINRSYMKKFGFTVAEITIFMQKND